MTRSLVLLTFLACACGSPDAPPAPAEPQRDAASRVPPPALEPPAPGEPGGLPGERTGVSEAPFTPESPQGGGNLVQNF